MENLKKQQQHWRWCVFRYSCGSSVHPTSWISEIPTFLHPYDCVFTSQRCYISSAASALSSYSDQIARGKTAAQAVFSSPLALLDYPRTWQETAQRSLISTLTVGSFCSVWMALLELVGFPSHWKIPRFFFLANTVCPFIKCLSSSDVASQMRFADLWSNCAGKAEATFCNGMSSRFRQALGSALPLKLI